MPVGVAKHGFWWVNGYSPITVFPGSLSTVDTATPDTVTFTATGGSAPTSPYVFSYTGTIPTGTSFDSSGHLTGTPTTPGTYNFTVVATDANGKTGQRAYTQLVISPDRSVSKSKNVLVVYDPNTAGGETARGVSDYYDYDVNPTDVYTVIAARETALGFTPSLCSSYSAMSSLNLNQYAHIWDIGYASPLTAGAASQYTSYLQNGGALYLAGENAYFDGRDTSLSTFITNIGGGTVMENTATPPGSYYISYTETVQSEFLLANSDNSITYNAPNVFDSYGTGTPISTGGSGKPSAVCWKTGSLSHATAGCIVSVLDINYWVGSDYNSDFIDNISITLNKK